MRVPWNTPFCIVLITLLCHNLSTTCRAQTTSDYADAGGGDGGDDKPATPPPPELENCNGIFVSYDFMGREKIYPHVKNATAQAWAFKAKLTVLNAGALELKGWQVHVGFQYNELLVSADGAVVMEGEGFPYQVGKNGTIFAGYPVADLKTAIETAGDLPQIQTEVKIKGTQFGLKTGEPMPKSIKLVNEGFKCPAANRKGTYMGVCCTKDPKFKPKPKNKFMARPKGDLTMVYDVLQASSNKYYAQITIDNLNPLGRLDQWNLTWEWMSNEFITSMKGAYTHKKDTSDCVYGAQGRYYKDFDFSNVMSCAKNPIISDLPPEKKDDEKLGKLPFCCKNGTLLPAIMNETQSRAIFQLEVFKLPPDMTSRTAINPPQNWKITGVLNPTYKCGPPVRVNPTEFPDPTGLDATVEAIASWQVACNITKPKPKENKCCVSYSAYYAASAVPCNTCACGCNDQKPQCDANAQPLPLPPEALLVPFVNRTAKAKAWAHLNGHKLPGKMPCPDNCGVSINWHVDSDYKSGWTARMTLFNWEEINFQDWFVAVQLKKSAPGYERAYSFNGTKLPQQKNNNTPLSNVIFLKGLPGLNYLMGEVNGTHPAIDPRVPGKQQTVMSFNKKRLMHLNIPAGDGFPSKLYFNGEECSLPTKLPHKAAGVHQAAFSWLPAIFAAALTFLLL